MSQKPPAKRSNFDKLPMDLINKISDMNSEKHLPVEIVVNTVIKVSCMDRGITITHTFTAVHKDDVVKRIMPSGWVETYLRQFQDSLFDLYSTTKIKSKLYFDKDLEQPIEKYRVSLTRNVGQRECKSIRIRLGHRVIDFNNKHEIMGMKCTRWKHWKKRDWRANSKVYEVESLYHPIKKEKVKVSKDLGFYNFKF